MPKRIQGREIGCTFCAPTFVPVLCALGKKRPMRFFKGVPSSFKSLFAFYI